MVFTVNWSYLQVNMKTEIHWNAR